jgi:hypothetical protein
VSSRLQADAVHFESMAATKSAIQAVLDAGDVLSAICTIGVSHGIGGALSAKTCQSTIRQCDRSSSFSVMFDCDCHEIEWIWRLMIQSEQRYHSSLPRDLSGPEFTAGNRVG